MVRYMEIIKYRNLGTKHIFQGKGGGWGEKILLMTGFLILFKDKAQAFIFKCAAHFRMAFYFCT